MKARLGRQADDAARGFAASPHAEKSGWQAAGADRAVARLLEESTAGGDVIKGACPISGRSEDGVRSVA